MAKEELKSKEFFRLYGTAQKRIYTFLLMMVHNSEDAEDLFQETACILWEKFDEFDRARSFAAWGVGIARNKALDFLKTKRTSRPMFDDDLYSKISDIAIKRDTRRAEKRTGALRDCVEKLSLQNQKLISLRFEKGIPVKKISQQSGLSAEAVYKRISRIYSALNNCIHSTLHLELT